MSSYPHPDLWIELGKTKMREFHQERQRVTLVKEAQKFQPRRIRTEVILTGFKRLFYRRKLGALAANH